MFSLRKSASGNLPEKVQSVLHDSVSKRHLLEPEGEPEAKEVPDQCGQQPDASLMKCCPPEDEEKQAASYPQLDLVFMCDCTGSMGSYIHAAQQNIRSIVDRVVSSEKAEVRFALVAYRDHPPQDSSFVTQIHPFTADVDVMKGYVDTMSASGGGDGPEAVTAALHDALNLPWRASATKIAILIADAPPHGLEPCGDGFPNGDPLGRDPLDIARQMAKHEIACYTVGCEPALGHYRFARDFMCTLAEITGGQAIALASAALLAEVIVQGSAEEISMRMLQREVEQELLNVRAAAQEQGEDLEDEIVYQRAAKHLHSRKVTSKQMRNDGKMKNSRPLIWHKSAAQTLASAKAELCTAEGVELESEASETAHTLESCSRTYTRARFARRAPTGKKCKTKRSLVGAVASVFRRRKTAPCFEDDDEIAELGKMDDETLCERKGSLEGACNTSLRPRLRCERKASADMTAPAAMSTSVLAEDLISVDQVARIATRAAHRKGGS